MIKNENIVCVSNTTWEGFYTKSTVQILSLLAKDNKVLFVEYPFTWKDLIMKLIGRGNVPVARMLGLTNRLVVKNTPNDSAVFHLIVPPAFPVEFMKSGILYQLFHKLNTKIYARSVNRALGKLEMKNCIVINAYHASYGLNLIRKFNEKLHVFYCYDGPDTRRFGNRAIGFTKRFAEKVDGVIVTSDFLAKTMKPFNSRIQVVKNGVDFRMFNACERPKTKDHRTPKRIGYIGSLDYRLDIDTVLYAVERLSDCAFEFVGELTDVSISEKLAGHPNITIKRPVQAHEVPKLLCQYDVGIIPYVCSEYTKNIYPLKINEYLSVGVPVVMTSFAALRDFDGIVSVSSDKTSFCNAIRYEIENTRPEDKRKRIEFAKANSWENRAQSFGGALALFLAEKATI